MINTHIDFTLARNEIVRAIALCEQQIQSALVPEQQKIGLQIARGPLFGSYAMVTLAMAEQLPVLSSDG